MSDNVKQSESSSIFRLNFLGGFDVRGPEGSIRFESAKTGALLVYLALNPAPQSRHKLMGLLWGDLPEVKARRNLRHALWDLRRKLNLPGQPPLIRSDEQSVTFNREAKVKLDVAMFEPVSECTLGQDAIQDMRNTVGDFLDGFYVSDAPQFEEWALLEREYQRTLAISHLSQFVEHEAARGETARALEAARRLLALDPWREEAHRQVMRLLAQQGHRTAALAQYETCRRTLAEGLGVEPAGETTALYEQIREDISPLRQTQDKLFTLPPSSLPLQTTTFVGREAELHDLLALLAKDDCQLVTITGPGGVGKTRLAIQVAAESVRRGYPHGIGFIRLAELRTAKDLVTAIAQASQLSFLDQQDLQAQLFAYLSGKRALIVLDSFEHLLAEAGFLAEMLRRCQEVKLLVTSRERLNLREEWTFQLEGLDYPERTGLLAPLSGPEETREEIEAYGAIRLFVQTAQRAHFGFRLTEDDRAWAARICQLVEGLPLAVELAAAWVRALSCEEIAREIERQLDFLTTDAVDIEARHRSLRAVFEHSWALLNEEEQRVFQGLSVFRSGFDRPAAERVTGASLAMLTALMDKSFLHRSPAGRYQAHELLRRYATEKLLSQPSAAKETGRRHSEYFAALLIQQIDEARSDPKRKSLAGLTHDLDNLRAAWVWAVTQADLALVETMSRGIHLICQMTASFQEGEAALRMALQALGWGTEFLEQADSLSSPTIKSILPWQLLTYQAGFQIYLGQLEQARLALERCLPVFRRVAAQEETARALFFLGDIARFLGNLAQSRVYLEESLAIYRMILDPGGIGFCLSNLGLIATASKEFDQARAFLEESRAIFEEDSNIWGQAIAGINLAALHKTVGDTQAAFGLLEESLDICRGLGHRWGMTTCLFLLADISRQRGDLPAAEKFSQDARAILAEVGRLIIS